MSAPNRRWMALAAALVLISGLLAGCAGAASESNSETPSSTTASTSLDPTLPTVSSDASGHPVVTIPDVDPPTEVKVEEITHGTGPVVHAGDVVLVDFQLVHWESGEVLDESWGSTAERFMTEGSHPAMQDAIIGRKTGTRLLVVLPPDDVGSRALPSQGVEDDDTFVYVMDIREIE